MRYFALAADYDGTLAHDGRVSDELLAALRRLRDSGRRLILVTGRELPDLERVFSHLDLFDRIVAENGALIFRPSTKNVRLLGPAAPEKLVEKLRARGVSPLSVGRVIIATWEPYEVAALKAIEELGLEYQVIFNKGAVMILPSGINKAAGLHAALDELRLSPHNVVGIGDAENDHAFLRLCECSVAVANALPSVKEQVDFVTEADHGEGAGELIRRMLDDDLASLEPRLGRHRIGIGEAENGEAVTVSPHVTGILIAGTSGSGKSNVVMGILERVAARGYQFCLVDPEGDYGAFAGAVALGSTKQPPTDEEVMQLMAKPAGSVVVNLLAVPNEDRPGFFAGLLPRIEELQTHTGRPHWLVVDEAHHLAPSEWQPANAMFPQWLGSAIFVTVHPDRVAPAVLSRLDMIVAVGDNPGQTIAAFAGTIGEQAPKADADLRKHEALIWDRRRPGPPIKVSTVQPEAQRRRHKRKYAQGELAPEKSFYFRGPEDKLNLRAQNLHFFVQLAQGVDDDTWMYHLRRGDYSTWFREMIGDEKLAAEAGDVETDRNVTPAESRARIRDAVEKRYTVPA